MTDTEQSAYTAAVVGDLTPDYRLLIREVWRQRLEFPELTEAINRMARRWRGTRWVQDRQEDLLKQIVIENKSSGISALQTIGATSEKWISRIMAPFKVTGDKEYRASEAAVWCKNGSVLLPEPGSAVPWLTDFEDELFNFPQSEFMDRVDAFSQLIIQLHPFLSSGFDKRNGRHASA
jgi:predicted phage terminase large subunit-like protein